MIPLVTSIPPTIKRQAADGTEIGEDYALACIRSWRSNGFTPVSVNAESEQLSELISTEEIQLISVKRDSRDQFGKPLVYLSDLITAACSLADGPVVLTNSDIVLNMPKVTKMAIADLKPGHCLVSRRYDICDMDSRDGDEYTSGYDFFAFHTRDLNGFSNDDFVFGMPWWDHYLPIKMYLRGLKSLPIPEPFAFHFAHEERWEVDNWVTLGKRFLNLMSYETSGELGSGRLARDYARLCAQAVEGHNGSFSTRLKRMLWRLRKTEEIEDDIQVLTRVAEVNMRWLDGLRLRF